MGGANPSDGSPVGVGVAAPVWTGDGLGSSTTTVGVSVGAATAPGVGVPQAASVAPSAAHAMSLCNVGRTTGPPSPPCPAGQAKSRNLS